MTFKTKELQSINPHEWQFYGLWKQNIFSACFWQSCFIPEVLSRFGFNFDFEGTMIGNGGNFFYHKPTIEKVGEIVKDKILKGHLKSFTDFKEEAGQKYLESINFAKNTSLGAPLTFEYFKEFLRHGREMSLYWWFAAVHLAVNVEKELQDKVVEHNISPSLVPNLLPKVDTPLIEQQKELIVLKEKIKGKSLNEIKSDLTLFNEIESHRKKYAWIEIANWIGEELTFEKLINQIEHSHQSSEESGVVVPESLKDTLIAMSATAFAKQGGAEYTAMYEYFMMPYLNRLAENLGISYREMMTLTHEEIEKVLVGGQNNLKELSQKKNRLEMRWILVSQKNNIPFLVETEEEILAFEKSLIPSGDSEEKEIKGQIGNKGKYTGKVKVIMNVDDFHKMESGDVLVTTMTTPDFVILMQKAGAIVTDIGGMLCHAAIVSREINRPCVIGAKVATKILKDGDMVEVDANTGIIKIINK